MFITTVILALDVIAALIIVGAAIGKGRADK